MSPTLQDIADRVGVSRMTVSEVLRGVGRSSPRTRQRVTTMAHKLGYRPNASARATRTGRFGSVALLMSTVPQRSFVPDVLSDGIYSALAAHDLHLAVAKLTDEALSDEASVPKILRQWMSDGLLISYTHQIPRRMTQLIEHYQIPSVWMNVKRRFDSVYFDDVAGGYEATRKLLQLGHRRIGYADYDNGQAPSRHYSGIDRRHGYERAMHEAGLKSIWLCEIDPLPGPWLRMPPRTFHGGRRLYYSLQWLQRASRPTAVVTYGPETAIPIMLAVERLGLRFPGDLSLITFGDHGLWQTSLAGATMVMRNAELGKTAVEMLLRKIANPAQPVESVKLGFDLWEAHTLGRPAEG